MRLLVAVGLVCFAAYVTAEGEESGLSYDRSSEGRTPDLAPCSGYTVEDGTNCKSTAHIYGKGCCCSFWGCCDDCKEGYHDDGCTCRKVDVGTLYDRQTCNADEDLCLALCLPKCKTGYHADPTNCSICKKDA